MKTRLLNDREISYRSCYRRVKSPRLEFEDGVLTLILPIQYPDEQYLLERHQKWIEKQIDNYENLIKISSKLSLSPNPDIEEFKRRVFEKIDLFAAELDVTIKKIVFKKLRSRWGSCSNDGQITVNIFLAFLPERLMEYILFHEVAHRIERGHNKKFYEIIHRRFKDRKLIERELRAYWLLLKQQQ